MRLCLPSSLLVVLLLTGCIEDSTDAAAPVPATHETVLCSDSHPSIFLLSKIDDEDGDGRIRDEDFPLINDEDDDIADHAWIRDASGVYHIFFQNEGQNGGSDVEHYTSTDLLGLDYVGVALARNPGGWDSEGIWAPHVVRSGDTYWMLYTGTSGNGPTSRQRIGLATSTDLTNWTRYPVNYCAGSSGDGCIYECDENWTTWGQANESYNQQCRDPFVIWDSENARWVMMITAKSTNQYGVVTVAYSTDLINWVGAGFVDATRRLPTGAVAQTTGGQCENPFVMTHDGIHYLLFSDWWDPEDFASEPDPRTMVQYATSSNLEFDTLGSAGWIYRGYIPDPGVNAIEVQVIDGDKWIMSQSISNPKSGDHDLHRRDLRLKCIDWKPNFEFDTYNATSPRLRRNGVSLVSPHVDAGREIGVGSTSGD